MFNTGRRTMEDVLLEHIGHEFELYEINEDGRDGIELWCNTCNDYVIKHFLTNPRPGSRAAWEIRAEQTAQRAERINALQFEEWQEGFIQDCIERDGHIPEYEGGEWEEIYHDYLDVLETQRGTTRTQRPTPANVWDVDEEFIPSREQNPPIYRATTGGFSARVWDVDEEDTWEN